MDDFLSTIEKKRAIICKRPPATNLPTMQWQALNELRNDTPIIIY